jgi:hypothetical protein
MPWRQSYRAGGARLIASRAARACGWAADAVRLDCDAPNHAVYPYGIMATIRTLSCPPSLVPPRGPFPSLCRPDCSPYSSDASREKTFASRCSTSCLPTSASTTVNTASIDGPATFLGRASRDEVVALTLDFYRRNYIEGLFLSSGIIQSPDYTIEQATRVARTLRERHDFTPERPVRNATNSRCCAPLIFPPGAERAGNCSPQALRPRTCGGTMHGSFRCCWRGTTARLGCRPAPRNLPIASPFRHACSASSRRARVIGNPRRYALMYRMVWRIAHGQRDLLDDAADDDVMALAHMAKKSTATVRR